MNLSSNFLSIVPVFHLRVVALLASSLLLFATIAKFFLPSSSIFFDSPSGFNYYKNYSFDKAFGITEVIQTASTQSSTSTAISLDSMKIKAIYAEKSGGGFVVIEDSKLSAFVSIGEEFKGYRLEALESRKALFTRNGQNYELVLTDTTPSIRATDTFPVAPAVTTNSGQTLSKIARKELNRYRNDARLIWDNVGINPITENGQFKEFRVTFVAKGSIFEQLGLMPGDILKSANGIELDGYAAALRLYAEVDKIDSFRLTVIRNNQVKELNYEIN